MREQLAALRRRMTEEHVDAYLIPSDDFHGSEYVGDYFKCRSYVSGFTGSAGTLIVLQDWAGLWTDGRYFLQAAQQLDGSGITLCKMGEKDVPTEEAFLESALQEGQCLGFDGRTITARRFHALEKKLAHKNIHFRTELDLVGDIWPDRPALPAAPAWALELRYCGKSRADKLSAVRSALAEQGADLLLLSSLDDIAWLLNIRGGDVACCLVTLAYLAVDAAQAKLFVNTAVIPETLRQALAEDCVTLSPYFSVYTWAAEIPETLSVWLDEEKTNCALWNTLSARHRILSAPNPTYLPKAIKNPTEVANEHTAHLYDGIAMTKFMFWLKSEIGKTAMTERSVSAYLEALRAQQPHYLGPSFDPILAYGHHGAIVHYSATEESDIPLEAEGFLLCDTGGHYLEGTTDITRTFVLGPISPEMRRHYTLVLRSHLALLNAQFLHGCRGSALDMLARQPLWQEGLDFNHGTGHGVGYLLSVHEGPNSFRFRSAGQDAVLEPGMIISDEPGLYLESRYGIRLENLIVCEERFENEYGRYLGFAPLTLVPFEREAIDPAMLSPRETEQLNRYHAAVREALSPHLTTEEQHWLEHATAPFPVHQAPDA